MNAVTRKEQAALDAPTVTFELNGQTVQGRTDEPLLEVARRHGVEVPHLCYKPGLDTAGILPTPEEAQAFAADNAPNKREKLIDQLLAGALDQLAPERRAQHAEG